VTDRRILPGSLVWVPDDGERGIVIAWNLSRTKVLVAFAAWKNGAETALVPDAQEDLFESGYRSKDYGSEPPTALPKGTFLAWYPVEHVTFSPPPWQDRARYCTEAYPEDALLADLGATTASVARAKLERLASLFGWDAAAKTEDGEPVADPDAHIENFIGLLENDLEAIDKVLGLDGEGRTRFYGDRAVRAQSLVRELAAYRNAAKAARYVR
jgi:hypothetical protein